VNRFTEFLVRRMIKVSHVSLPNLIAGREIVPEMLQANCTPELLAAELEAALKDGTQRRALAEVSLRLGVDEMRATGERPSDRAARAVMEAIEVRRRGG
jgi:lipid-A-disaccharide synthase